MVPLRSELLRDAGTGNSTIVALPVVGLRPMPLARLMRLIAGGNFPDRLGLLREDAIVPLRVSEIVEMRYLLAI